MMIINIFFLTLLLKTEFLFASSKPSCYPTINPATGLGIYQIPGKYPLTIPVGVTALNVKLWGAGGAGGAVTKSYTGTGFSGGSGGYTTCFLPVTSGNTIQLIVGDGGQVASSFGTNSGKSFFGGGGSGNSANDDWSGGGGGGRSAIQLVDGTDSVVADGGGGGGAYCNSGNTGVQSGGGGGGLNGLTSAGLILYNINIS